MVDSTDGKQWERSGLRRRCEFSFAHVFEMPVELPVKHLRRQMFEPLAF